MSLIHGRGDQEALPRKIGPEAPAGDFQGLQIDLSRPHLDGEHGLQLHNRKVRDQGSRTRLLKDAVHVFGSVLFVVSLRECARVEKVVWQISALAQFPGKACCRFSLPDSATTFGAKVCWRAGVIPVPAATRA